MRHSLIYLLLASLLVSACAQSTPAAAPTSAGTTATTPVVAAATDTAASAPLSTLAPTTAATASPIPATGTAAPTVTATAAVVNPLTGLAVDDPSTMDRRPLAVKVAHFPRSVREFQVGLSLADNVWEHYAEGGTVRFTAIFLGQAPERIGNVRSARLIDTYLGQAYQAMLVASGSSSGTMNRLRQTDFFKRVIAEATGYSGCPILCREESASVTTNKLFTSAPALWDLTTKLGLNGRQSLDGFTFDPQPPAGGEPASTVHIDFLRGFTVAEWRYDEATHTYARWIDTDHMPDLAPQVDSANGQALSAANVVVLTVPYVTSNIHEVEGDKVYYSYDILLYGSGSARLFRDGQMYVLTWQRDQDKGGLPRLVDASGNSIPFRPGVTWFEVASDRTETTFDNGVFTARVRVPGLPAVLPTATP